MKSKETKLKKNFKSFINYYLTFFIAIIFWELVIRLQMGNGIKAENMNFLWFVPAEALFLTMLCGYGKEIINRILTPVILFIVSIYYIVQLVYYRNFGSLFSLSMTGMGTDAVGNFWWALKDTLLNSLVLILVLIIPVILVIVLCIINKPKWVKYSIVSHAICLFAVVALWFMGILGLRIGGNERQSAYYLFFNTLADTDSVSVKFGAMTTTILEAGSYYFGIGSDRSNLAAVNVNDTMLGVKKDAASVNKVVSSNTTTVSEDEVSFIAEPHINENIDFNVLKTMASNDKEASMCDFFASRSATNTNQYTGLFENYNVIYICAEAFSIYACDEKANPTLYKMANNGIILNNFYNSFKNTTTNGEFAFDTSLWPDVSRQATCGTDVGSFPQSASKFLPQGLADLCNANGYTSYAYHNYYGEYYRRVLSWPNLGYENMKFMGSGMSFTTSWPASDYEMMQQSVDDYIDQDKFHAYYMTFSGHGPFTSSNCIYNKNIAEVKELLGENDLEPTAIGYLAGNHELDKAMEYLLQRLEEAGKLDNTVIVICGDHYPYYMNDTAVDSLAGHTLENDFERYKSTCIIYNAAMEENIETDTYCCNVDILPTILNLLNIDYDSRLYMGTDIFDDSAVHKATLYNLNFATNLVKYNSSTGEATWSDEASNYTKEELDKYLEAMISLTEAEYEASTNIISDNFFKFVWEKSGLFTEEELYAENQREKEVSSKALSINSDIAEREAAKEAEEALEKQAEAQNAATAHGWVFDPNTNYAYDPATGVIYEPISGTAVGNINNLNNPAAATTDTNDQTNVTDTNAATNNGAAASQETQTNQTDTANTLDTTNQALQQ